MKVIIESELRKISWIVSLFAFVLATFLITNNPDTIGSVSSIVVLIVIAIMLLTPLWARWLLNYLAPKIEAGSKRLLPTILKQLAPDEKLLGAVHVAQQVRKPFGKAAPLASAYLTNHRVIKPAMFPFPSLPTISWYYHWTKKPSKLAFEITKIESGISKKGNEFITVHLKTISALTAGVLAGNKVKLYFNGAKKWAEIINKNLK